MLHTAVALSIILGFICTEFLGILTGGMISAGYLALFFEQPFRILSTVILAIIVYLIVKLFSNFLILFGRRRFMLTIIIGLIMSVVVEKAFILMTDINQDMRIVGYIIPGLIANDMLKQGVLKTLLLVLLLGGIIWLIMHAGFLG